MTEFKPIISSNLKEASYDAATETLIVRFRNETQYSYPNVTAELYREFEETFSGDGGKSAGKFFNANIKNLPCEKVEA